MYTLAYKTKKSNYISSFKIQGDSLNSMYITPVENCVVDFGDGTKQTYTGNNSSTQVTHSYSESNTFIQFKLLVTTHTSEHPQI